MAKKSSLDALKKRKGVKKPRKIVEKLGRPAIPLLDRKLSGKAFKFAHIYKGNGKEAVIKAGYSEKGAAVKATDLLRDPRIIAIIEAGKEKLAEVSQVSKEDIVNELKKLGFCNMADYTKIDPVTGQLINDFSNLTRDQAAAIKEVTIDHIRTDEKDGKEAQRTKFKLVDKRRNLMDLAKLLGHDVDTVVHKGNVRVINEWVVTPVKPAERR